MRLRNIGERRSKKNLVLVPPRKRINHVFECCALCSLLGRGECICTIFLFSKKKCNHTSFCCLHCFCTIVKIYF